MRKLSILILFLVAFLLSSCGSSSTDSKTAPEPRPLSYSDPFLEPPAWFYDQPFPFDSTLSLYIYKRSNRWQSEPDSAFVIDLYTDREYGCCNYTIVQTVSTGRGSITIQLRGVFTPAVCLTAMGPAKSYSAFDLPDGGYTLSVRYESVTDIYQMEVTGGALAVTPKQTSFTHLAP